MVAGAALVILGAMALWLAPLVTGPAIPRGATPLRLATSGLAIALGCHTAAVVPARVSTADDELVLIALGSEQTLRPVWPGGFAAWRRDGRAELADPWGNVIAREGDVLDTLSGGLGDDGRFHICPLGIVPRAGSSL
jgi:hypothetical protein